MTITETTQVAEVASKFPATIRVFQRNGVDFCCGGKRPLSEVCEESGIAFDGLKGELQAAIDGPAPAVPSLVDMPLEQLTRWIVERYHVWLKDEMPRMSQMMDKVLRVHGERHPELAAVARTYAAIQADIVPHLMKEEQILFPYIERLASRDVGSSCFGTVENPIRMMEYEHEVVGGLLAELRRLTSGYTAPEDACNTFRGLYHAFSELEKDTHEHIHVENNILHPRALELERTVGASVVA